MTTSNGTRALRSCGHAGAIWIASFANISAVAECILAADPDELLIICSGTQETSAYEDVLGAGALVDRLFPELHGVRIDDAAHLACIAYRSAKDDLLAAMENSRNGRRLLNLPDLAPDVALCLKIDRFDFVPEMDSNGVITRPI